MIGQCSALDGYNEIIRLNKISSEEIVTIPNGKEIKLENMMEISLSFGQVNGFEVEQDLILFMFIGFVTEPLKKDDSIEMVVNLVKGQELVEEKAICKALENVEPKDGAQLEADFECKIEGIEKPEEYTGLEIVSSKDISGIPTNSNLLNPAKVDELIKDNEIQNYTSEEFKPEEIPVFNATSIDTINSKETGTFTIIGEFLSDAKIEKSFEFEIILLTGEKALCTLPKISDDEKEIKIECILQEELKDSKIMIGQCSALDD